MKLIYATLFLTVLAVFVNGQNEISAQDFGADSYLEKAAAYRRTFSMARIQRTIEEICPGQFENFENALAESIECDVRLKESDSTVCSMLKQDVTQCLTPTFNFFRNCVPENRKFAVKLVENMAINAVKYLCSSNVEHLMELINPCTKSFTVKHQCVKTMIQKIEDYQRKRLEPTKERFCEMMTSYTSCAQSFVQSHCHNPITRETYKGAFDVFNKLCY